MIRRILGTNTFGRIAVLVCALAPLLTVPELDAQAVLTVPAGLPDWAFNIPDTIQPTSVRPEGILSVPGSAKEYDAAEYLIRQMAYYKAGTRKDDARMGPIAQVTSDKDVRQAAEYFAALKPGVWVKVIETATPPKTFIATAGRHRVLHPDGGTEPIGRCVNFSGGR